MPRDNTKRFGKTVDGRLDFQNPYQPFQERIENQIDYEGAKIITRCTSIIEFCKPTHFPQSYHLSSKTSIENSTKVFIADIFLYINFINDLYTIINIDQDKILDNDAKRYVEIIVQDFKDPSSIKSKGLSDYLRKLCISIEKYIDRVSKPEKVFDFTPKAKGWKPDDQYLDAISKLEIVFDLDWAKSRFGTRFSFGTQEVEDLKIYMKSLIYSIYSDELRKSGEEQ